MPSFDPQAQSNFVSTAHRALISGDINTLLPLLITKQGLSHVFSKLGRERDLEHELEKCNADALKSGTALLNTIREEIHDFSTSRFIDVHTDVTDKNGVLGTGSFSIVFKTTTQYLKIRISEVISIDGALFWTGSKLSLGTSSEPFTKPSSISDVPKFDTSILVGNLDVSPTSTLEFQSQAYIDLAHQNPRVYDSLHITGDLDLDALYNDGIYAIFVKHDLFVTGNIINTDGDVGSSLFVLGETRAKNLLAGGSVISLNSAIIDDFTIGFYNHGVLSINALATNISLQFDHYTEIANACDTLVSMNSDANNDQEDIELLAKYLYNSDHSDGLVTYDVEDDGDEFYDIDYDVLNRLICDNQHSAILKSINDYSKTFS